MIKSVYIERFGKIKDTKIEFSDGLNIIFGKNESGKSTVFAFIRAMLYGVDTERGRGVRNNMRKRYAPASGGTMSGVMETDEYVITRSFGASPKFDVCTAVNKETGEIIPPEKIGEAVMGMSEVSFLNTFCMTSFDAYPESESELLSMLGGGDGANGGASYDRVREVLDGMLRPYTKRGGIIACALEKAQKAQAEYENDMKKRRTAEEIKQKYELIIKKREQTEKELSRLENAKEELAKKTVELRAKQQMLFKEIANESVQEDEGIKIIPTVLGSVFGLIGLLFMLSFKNPMFLVCIGAFIPMGICFSKSGLFKKRGPAAPSADIQLAAIEKIMAKTTAAEDAGVDDKIKRANEILRECALRIGQAENALKSIKLSPDAQNNAKAAREEYERAVYEKECIELAQRELDAVYSEMKSDFMPKLNTLFSKYIERITGGKYAKAAADRDMKLAVVGKNGVTLWEYLSSGTLDGAYFALRLALCALADDENRCTLMLDDPFLQYDEERAKNAYDVLDDENRQIICFTCRKDFGEKKFIKI